MDFAPSPEALELSQRLTNKIRNTIEAEGPISFSHFMQMTLYEPGLGYYSAGSIKFGSEGDFITAPEISPLFGQCLARQIQQVFDRTNSDTILELGAGTGRLACDILKQLEKLAALPSSYQILEVSADLRDRQQSLINQQIPHLADRVSWLDQLPGQDQMAHKAHNQSQSINGVILANEVLDALPVDRFQIIDGESREICVTITDIADQEFEFTSRRPSAQLNAAISDLQISDTAENYTSEVNLQLPAWFAGLANSLDRGVIFCVDYGYSRRDYYHPQRNNGTLLCHYHHRVHDDPFSHIGLQDITASVDFTAVAEAAYASGLSIDGYTTQTHFLINCGLLELLAEYQISDQDLRSKEYIKLTQQAKTLTLPGEMGERFKTIALSKEVDDLLLGFSSADQLANL